MSKKSPQLRFEGFTDDWEVRKLTDVTYSYSGLTYSPTDVQDKGTFVLRSSNVKNDQLIDADNVYVNPDIVNSNNVKVGDVIVVVRNGSRSLIGKHAIVTKEMPHTVIGAFMSAFRGENGDYINALLSTNNFQKEVHKSLGATINQITGKDFSMMNFLTPKLEEQNKIGSFFKQLDNTIALHQRKLDLLKEQKKGYLQKMFPKNGAKVPELRFAGFADDWEERKLDELVEQIIREVPKPNKPYYRMSVRSHAKGTFRQFVDNPDNVAMDKLFIVKKDDLVVNITFAWEHAIAVVKEENDGLLVSHRFPTYRADGKSDIKFLNYVVSKEDFRRKLEFISPGGAGRNRVLNKKDFLKLKIFVPKIEEQQKIGSFFKQLDDTIALHQRKLDLLKERKKGFLQKMFV